MCTSRRLPHIIQRLFSFGFRVTVLSSFFSITFFFLLSNVLLSGLRFPSGPFLLSLPFRHFLCSSSSHPGIDGVVIPRGPRPHIFVDVNPHHLFSSSEDKVQLRRLLFLFWAQMSVRKSVFFRHSALKPRGRVLANEFLHNSVPHINIYIYIYIFLQPPGSLSYPLPTQWSVHPTLLLDVFFVCTHHTQFHIEITCTAEVFGSTSSSFSWYIQNTGDTGLISKLLLESGAHTLPSPGWC